MDYTSAPSYDQSLYQYQQPPADQQQQQQQLIYDPSQIQHYDPSTQQQSYYAYGQHYDQNYQYYAPPHGYATTTSSYAPQSHMAYQQVNASASHMAPGEPKSYSQSQENAYFAMHVPPPSHQQGGWPHVPPQYWENSSAGQQIGQCSYRRGGKALKRGGGAYGRGGRGQGGGKWYPRGAAMAANKASAAAGRGAGPAQLRPAAGAGQAPPGQEGAPPSWPPRRMAWCELCRVDCNTLEILEQHKNGKRHKKNMRMDEELQRLNKVVAGQEADAQLLSSGTMAEACPPEKVVVVGADDGSQEKQVEILTSEVVSGDHRNEAELPSDDAARSSDPAARGFKRKMRGRSGRSYFGRSSKKFRRPSLLPPHQRVPYICELCNVKSESQADFNLHLTGKRHLTKARHFLGPRAASLGANAPSAGPPPADSFRPPLLDACHPLIAADPQVQMLLSLMIEGLAQAAPTQMVPELARYSALMLQPHHAPAAIMPPPADKSPDNMPPQSNPEKSPPTVLPETETDKSPVQLQKEPDSSPVTMLPEADNSALTMMPLSEGSPVTTLPESEKSPGTGNYSSLTLTALEKCPDAIADKYEAPRRMPEAGRYPMTMEEAVEAPLTVTETEPEAEPDKSTVMEPEAASSTAVMPTEQESDPHLDPDASPAVKEEPVP